MVSCVTHIMKKLFDHGDKSERRFCGSRNHRASRTLGRALMFRRWDRTGDGTPHKETLVRQNGDHSPEVTMLTLQTQRSEIVYRIVFVCLPPMYHLHRVWGEQKTELTRGSPCCPISKRRDNVTICYELISMEFIDSRESIPVSC